MTSEDIERAHFASLIICGDVDNSDAFRGTA
jgi:hypothetical protein